MANVSKVFKVSASKKDTKRVFKPRASMLPSPSHILPLFPLSSYALDERQVLLLSEQRSFRLTGKLYVALLPFLDGNRTGRP